MSLTFACGPESPGETDSGPGTSSPTSSEPGTGSTAGVPTSSATGDDSGSAGETGSAPVECPEDIPSIATPEALAETVAAITCANAEACGCPDVPADCVAQEIEGNTEYDQAHLDLGLEFDPVCAGVFAFNEEHAACERDVPIPCPGCAWFVGRLREGEACEVGMFGVHACVWPLECVLGRCVELAVVGQGEACADGPSGETIAQCAEGQFCRSSTGTCAPVPAGGEPCVDKTCAPDGWCDEPAEVCQPRLPDGSACFGSGECLSLRCEDMVCVTNSLACRLVAD